jgi:hypothetical protein
MNYKKVSFSLGPSQRQIANETHQKNRSEKMNGGKHEVSAGKQRENAMIGIEYLETDVTKSTKIIPCRILPQIPSWYMLFWDACLKNPENVSV